MDPSQCPEIRWVCCMRVRSLAVDEHTGILFYLILLAVIVENAGSGDDGEKEVRLKATPFGCVRATSFKTTDLLKMKERGSGEG